MFIRSDVSQYGLEALDVEFRPPFPDAILQAPLEDNLNLEIGTGSLTFTRSTTATFVDKDDGLVKTAAVDTPRFETDGILMENAVNNKVLNSGDQTASNWSPGIGSFWTTVSSTDVGDPSGPSNTATRHTANATPSALFVRETEVKASGGRTGSMWFYVPSGQSVSNFSLVCDWQDVEIGSTDTSTVFDKWVRLESSATLAANRNSTDYSMRADGSVPATGFIFYTSFGQDEPLQFASSYIPTVETSLTRAADNLSIGSTGNFDASTGTISLTAHMFGVNTPTNQYFFSIDDGTNNERHLLFKPSGSNDTRAFIKDNNVTQADYQGGAAWTAGDVRKLVTTYAVNDVETFSDAVSIGTDTVVTLPTVTTINIGTDKDGVQGLFGHIKNFQTFAVVLTDVQIAALNL